MGGWWHLAYVAHTAGGPGTWIAPTVIATAMGLVGTWASVAGNELSMRLGRQRLVRIAMTSCIVCAAGIGFLGSRSYGLAALLTLGYGALIWLDSSSLTAGAAGSADPNRRGATLALHSMFGYAGGMLGPLAIGWILDLAGGMSPIGWGLAFLHLGVVVLIGELCFTRLRPGDLAGIEPSGRWLRPSARDRGTDNFRPACATAARRVPATPVRRSILPLVASHPPLALALHPRWHAPRPRTPQLSTPGGHVA